MRFPQPLAAARTLGHGDPSRPRALRAPQAPQGIPDQAIQQLRLYTFQIRCEPAEETATDTHDDDYIASAADAVSHWGRAYVMLEI